jgi:hypothetical protein
MGIFFLVVWTLISGLGIALFVKCKPFRSFLVILLSRSPWICRSLPDFLLHAHLDLVEMLKNNSEIPQNRVGMVVSSELTPLI